MTSRDPRSLTSSCLRLRPDASVEELEGGESFWARLAQGELGDFHNEYLVTQFSYDSDWASWEMHPNGDEIVCLLSGQATFVLETASGASEIELVRAGDYVRVPRGTWHTARTRVPTTMLFITAGEGTQHRPA